MKNLKRDLENVKSTLDFYTSKYPDSDKRPTKVIQAMSYLEGQKFAIEQCIKYNVQVAEKDNTVIKSAFNSAGQYLKILVVGIGLSLVLTGCPRGVSVDPNYGVDAANSAISRVEKLDVSDSEKAVIISEINACKAGIASCQELLRTGNLSHESSMFKMWVMAVLSFFAGIALGILLGKLLIK